MNFTTMAVTALMMNESAIEKFPQILPNLAKISLNTRGRLLTDATEPGNAILGILNGEM